MRRLVVALVFLLLPAFAEAAPTPRLPDGASRETILSWINGYRRNPDPDRVPVAIRSLARIGQLADPEGSGVYVGFLAGIIATNTTLDHSSIPSARDQEGGLSGAPLRGKSTALVRAIAARSTIPVVASGGIFDAESAREKFEAGAQLLQLYTGYIYRGPGLLREIIESLS